MGDGCVRSRCVAVGLWCVLAAISSAAAHVPPPGPLTHAGGRACPTATGLLAAAPVGFGSQPGPPAQAPSFDLLRAEAERARSEGRLDDAIAAYREAVARHPAWIEGYWYLGTLYYENDRYAECRDAFTRVVQRQTKNGAAWAFKGLCGFQVSDYDTAFDDLARGREFGLGHSLDFAAIVRFHHAMLSTRAGHYERALQDLSAFGRHGNTTEELTLALGLALLRIPRVPAEVPPAAREMVVTTGRAVLLSLGLAHEEARRVFAQLVERYPETPNVHYAYGLLLSSELPNEALEQFRQELRISPDHAMARVNIAQELLKRAEHGAALPLAEEAARLAPENFVARRLLGQLKLETGDVSGAISELEAARRLEPDSPSVRFQLARAYRRADRAADANRERAEFTRLERELRAQRGGTNAVGDPEATPGTPPP